VKRFLTVLALGLFGLSALSACKQEAPVPAAEKPSMQNSAPQAAESTEAKPAGRSGTVVETMDAANYTYIKVDTGSETFWAATNKMPVSVGDSVLVPAGTPMPGFHSKELDRTFDMIYFVGSVMVGGSPAEAASTAMPDDHPAMTPGNASAPKTDIDLSGIKPAEGGVTVAEIFSRKSELAGKPVTVRGKVVKFSPQIMQKNWLHIQDGTGEEGSNDLTVTTNTPAAVGDTVVISGVLSTDVDFGYGYQYGVIVEDAEVTAE